MKWSDLLKKLGVNVDDEIKMTEEKEEKTEKTALEVNNDVIKNDMSVSDTKTSVTEEKTEEVKEDAVVKLVYDEKTGLFDTTGIEDTSIVEVLTKANEFTINAANKVLIDKAFDSKMAGLKIRKGITTDAVRSLVKMDDIKVENGKVVGIDEAFDKLQSEQSGLFVQRNTPESNPMLEGFNPVQNTNDNGSALNASLADLSATLSGSN